MAKVKPPGRPRLTGQGRTEPTHQRTCTCNRLKLEIVEYYFECKKSMTKTVSKYFSMLSAKARDSMRKLIYVWIAQHVTLKLLCADPKTADLKYIRPVGVATILPVDAEKDIVGWINMLRKAGVPVSKSILEMKAIDVADEYGVEGLKASWHWRQGFLRRHQLSMNAHMRQGQITPERANDIALGFGIDVQQKMLELGVTKVYNADQTDVFFEILPKQTVTPRGAKTAWVRHGGKDKERVTVMLLAHSDGNKITPFLVFKVGRSTIPGGDAMNWSERRGFGVRIWMEAKTIMEKTGMEFYGNPAAWWNSDVHMEFLKVAFGSRPRPWQPVILLVDDFSGHWAAGVEAYALSIDLHLMKVPPSCTTTAQLADISWNRPFKNYLRRAWVAYLQNQLRNYRGSSSAFEFRAPNISVVAEWVKDSWDQLSRSTIMNSFSKAHIISPLPSACEAPFSPLLPESLPGRL